MLGVKDAYTAYCLDEAGAFLLAQPEPPKYRRRALAPANRDKRQLKMLALLGARVNI